MHKGNVIAQKDDYQVIDCDVCQFAHLNPLPSGKEISEFYQKEYYDLIKEGNRAPEIRRQMENNDESTAEREWLGKTLYSEIAYILNQHVENRTKNILDIGCGTGEFLKYIKNFGWDTIGIEPSQDKHKGKSSSGLQIHNSSLEAFISGHPEYANTFDAVILLNVLEHVLNPLEFLQHAKELLQPQKGIICIRVPNDFNEFQLCAEKKLNKKLWWVTIPDHLNYFNHNSLQKILESMDFEILYKGTDFPMELFLLMGDDYTENSELGGACHKKRMRFDLSLPDELRRKFYQGLAQMGIGRDILIFARVRGEQKN